MVCRDDPASGREVLPLHRLEVSEPDILPFAIGSFDAVGPLSRADFPHRHTFHEIVYVTDGHGSHTVDLEQWPLALPHLCVILPGQVHSWEHASGLRGWVILFSEEFLFAHPEDRDLVRDLGGHPLPEARQDIAELAILVREMEQEYVTAPPGRVGVLQAYLHVLIMRAHRLLGADERPSVGGPVALARRFDRLLVHPGQTGRSVHAYAGRLGVSASYLNECIRAATGRTPGQLIRQAQALEAKRLLAGTTLTVRQIAREVGFTDSAYFCRFFRRETGVSPGGFRRAIG